MQLINRGISWFSENIAPLQLSGGDGAVISFTVYMNNDLFHFKLNSLIATPYINITEMLKAQISVFSISNNNEPFSKVRVVAENTNTKEVIEWSAAVIPGGYSKSVKINEEAFLRDCFLTWRSETAATFRGLKQQLTYANTGTSTSSIKRDIYVRAYFKARLPLEYKLTSFSFSDNKLQRINCSLNVIENIMLENSITDEIVAYDIYGVTERAGVVYKNTPKTQRFVVGRANIRQTHFFFQNSLGGFDTITAYGTLKHSLQGDISTVLINQNEIETSNTIENTYEVNTGYIINGREKNLWNEFLQSNNRYLISIDGKLLKIIIDDFKADFENLSLSNYTFKFRLSKKDRTLFINKQDLPEYNYEKTEL